MKHFIVVFLLISLTYCSAKEPQTTPEFALISKQAENIIEYILPLIEKLKDKSLTSFISSIVKSNKFNLTIDEEIYKKIVLIKNEEGKFDYLDLSSSHTEINEFLEKINNYLKIIDNYDVKDAQTTKIANILHMLAIKDSADGLMEFIKAKDIAGNTRILDELTKDDTTKILSIIEDANNFFYHELDSLTTSKNKFENYLVYNKRRILVNQLKEFHQKNKTITLMPDLEDKVKFHSMSLEKYLADKEAPHFLDILEKVKHTDANDIEKEIDTLSKDKGKALKQVTKNNERTFQFYIGDKGGLLERGYFCLVNNTVLFYMVANISDETNINLKSDYKQNGAINDAVDFCNKP